MNTYSVAGDWGLGARSHAQDKVTVLWWSGMLPNTFAYIDRSRETGEKARGSFLETA